MHKTVQNSPGKLLPSLQNRKMENESVGNTTDQMVVSRVGVVLNTKNSSSSSPFGQRSPFMRPLPDIRASVCDISGCG